jgi:hypothetical protein
MECVIKTALDSANNIQWQGLYVKGKKVLENYVLDIDIAVSIFAPGCMYRVVNIHEDDFSSITSSFPDEEDFSYLLDCDVIQVGSMVWLEDGLFEVTEIRTSYRMSGNYKYVEWQDGKPTEQTMFYSGHTITQFKVKGKRSTLVWEDYNYQQSNLYELNNKKESI